MFLPSSLGIVPPNALLEPVDESLWNPVDPPSPGVFTDTEAVGINLGVLFQVDKNGSLHSLCYYRASDTMSSSGTMALWRLDDLETDVLLASADFTGHSGTGWKIVELDEPVTLSPAKAHVASVWFPAVSGSVVYAGTSVYFLNSGHFSTPWAFLYGWVSNGQTDPRGFIHRNGLYLYGAFGRPTDNIVHANYWVDVIFNARPTAIPPQPPLILKWPIPDGWPTFSNTGPDPDTVFEEPELETVSTSVDGQIIENRELRASLFIQHDNVIVRNCIVWGTNAPIAVTPGLTNILIEDCLIDGLGRNNAGSAGISISSPDVTVRRCDIRRLENGVAIGQVSNIIIEDNFMHHLRATPGIPHYDTMQMDGGMSGVEITHNTLMNENGDAAVIMQDNLSGAIDDILIQDNYCCGAGYTFYVDGRFTALGITNVRYLRNMLHMGMFGYFNIADVDPLPTLEGNQYFDHGEVFDSPTPGGFVEDQIVPEGLFGYVAPAGSIIGETVSVAVGGLSVGVAFQVSQSGQITSINFARPSFSSTVNLSIGLWRFTGSDLTDGIELLGTRAFTAANKTGLRNFAFTVPIDVVDGDNLLAGVFIPRGSDGKVWYFAESDRFASAVASQWERFAAFANDDTFFGGNGLFHYGSTLIPPLTASGGSSNYNVDPVFVAPWVV